MAAHITPARSGAPSGRGRRARQGPVPGDYKSPGCSVGSAGSEDPLTTTGPLTLVLVEDDEDVRVALGRLLRAIGHRVYPFGSAEAFDANPVPSDCLILDVRLPGMSGFELYERNRLRGIEVPVVFITGESGSPRDGTPGIEQIGAPLLSKPFSEEELLDAIGRAMAPGVR